MTNTNTERIRDILTRGVENVYPSREFAEGRLESGERLTFYLGVDPTGPTLHLGHMIPMLKLAQLQILGHKIILLIGDFTAMVGDPDKVDVRKQLSRDEVVANASLYREQAEKVLVFSGENPAEIRYNSEWLARKSFGDVLALASHMTVGQMIERDMFQRRIKDGRPIYLHEFLYPLMQGFDSVEMGVHGEIGGSDQTFNMLVGRTLMKQISGQEKIVITMRLLEDAEGNKMGKTEGNMVALTDAPHDMFGKVMRFPDELIVPGLTLCTRIPEREIEEIEAALLRGGNPRDAKLRLAYEITATYAGTEVAERARDGFIEAFQKGGVPDDVREVLVPQGSTFADALVSLGVVASRGDWRRLVEHGGVHTERGDTIWDTAYEPAGDEILKIGKHRFVKVVRG